MKPEDCSEETIDYIFDSVKDSKEFVDPYNTDRKIKGEVHLKSWDKYDSKLPEPDIPKPIKMSKTYTSSGCFFGDTLISTVKGPNAISALERGEEIFCYDEKIKSIVISRVSKKVSNTSDNMGVLCLGYMGKKLIVSGNHRFYSTNRGWVEANDFCYKDKFLSKELKVLNSYEVWFPIAVGKMSVYNLEVEQYHNYFAENVLVHNMKC